MASNTCLVLRDGAFCVPHDDDGGLSRGDVPQLTLYLIWLGENGQARRRENVGASLTNAPTCIVDVWRSTLHRGLLLVDM